MCVRIYPDYMARNVVLILLDGVRKDSFDRYALRLQRAADVSFEGCRATSAWSIPSHASMLTGELAHQHGIHTYERSFSGLSREETFLGSLDEHESIGVSANYYVGSAFGFDTLFDEFVDVTPEIRYPDSWDGLDSEGSAIYSEFAARLLRSGRPFEYLSNGLSTFLGSRLDGLPIPSPYDGGAVPTIRAARREIDGATEPFFLFVNFMDAHQPLTPHVHLDDTLHSVPNSWTSKNDFYRVKWALNYRNEVDEHEEFLANYRALYGAAIGYLDRRVSAFVETIRRSTDNETVFVVTSDHGENLAFESDEYYFEHTGCLTESLLHVPLCIIGPSSGYNKTEREYFSQLETGELLTGLATGTTPEVFDERIAAEVVGLSPGTSPLSDEQREGSHDPGSLPRATQVRMGFERHRHRVPRRSSHTLYTEAYEREHGRTAVGS
jgi:hypothetical protein